MTQACSAIRSLALRAGLALGVAGATHALAAEGTHTAKAITAEHPAAQALKQALESGEAFRLSFAYVDPSLGKEARLQHLRLIAAAIRRLRRELPKEPSFELLAGIEFTLAPTDEKTVAVKQPVGGEDAAHASTFRLASEPRQQVYLLFRVRGEGDLTWHLHALMTPVAGGWKSGGLTLFTASFREMDAEAALAAAQKEGAAGRNVLALALLGLANRLGSMPRYRASGLHKRLREAYEPVAQKLGVPDKAIATVTTSRGKFGISYVNARVYRRGAYLLIFREVAKRQWPGIEAHQRKLAAAFLKAHPQLKQYFIGLGVNERYTDPTGREHDDRSLFLNAELEAKSGTPE